MDVNPRKFPKQARAQATVEAIIIGAAQVLTAQGFEGLTTARVAERAGVSIGSLYQYFPNKQALAAAVVDCYGELFAAAFRQAMATHPQGTLSQTVDAMIEFASVSYQHGPELHRALNELASRVDRVEKIGQISARIAGVIEEQLRLHTQEIAGDLDLADAAALIETILETVVHRAIEHHPVNVGGERMIKQCRRLILGFLTFDARG